MTENTAEPAVDEFDMGIDVEFGATFELKAEDPADQENLGNMFEFSATIE